MERRICIFCGSSRGHSETYELVAARAAKEIVGRGYGLVYGGGRIGLMGVVANAALAAGGEVHGVIPRALSHAEVAHDGLTALHVVATMHERKALMVDLSEAFVALPGGYGTMDEFTEVLTWRQLGIHGKPIGLLNADGFFNHLIAQFDHMTSEGFVGVRDHGLFAVAGTIEALLDAMKVTG